VIGAPYVEGALLALGLTALSRATFRLWQKRLVTSRVLILGNGPLVSDLIDVIESSSAPRYVLTGVLDNEPFREDSRAPWLGPLDRLGEIVEEVRADRIVVALPDRRGQLPLMPLLESRARGVAVDDALDFYERLSGQIAIEALTPGSLINADGFRNHGAPGHLARTVSVVVALIGLTLLAPLLAVIALAIKLDSEGAVLFVQERIGRGGRPFALLKFRTMRPHDGPRSEWVQDNVDRITRVGKWLRRFRLDEVPQLVNIVRGEMNLVGPRPHPTCNQEIFMERIAYYGLRSTIRPGVTGWAQVRYGYANNIEEETEKMRYDLYYIKNRSLWLELRIMLETVATVIFGKGATEVSRRRAPLRPAFIWASARRGSFAAPTPADAVQLLPWLPAAAPTPAQPSAGQQ
jgi:exopolysaccharide biosynthesis polyprenyl glycosylphosphotransferase